MLVAAVQASGIVFALTHNYTGYPMVKQARHMVRSGELGDILKTVVEYPQGWLLTALEAEEVMTEIVIPAFAPRTGYAYCKLKRKHPHKLSDRVVKERSPFSGADPQLYRRSAFVG